MNFSNPFILKNDWKHGLFWKPQNVLEMLRVLGEYKKLFPKPLIPVQFRAGVPGSIVSRALRARKRSLI
jgi:hypothetical protein